MYTMPTFPLLANVWFTFNGPLPPADLPVEVDVSLSPIAPQQYYQILDGVIEARPTHIIRMLPDSRLGDSHTPNEPSNPFPCSLFEVPPGSGHYYAAVWAHQVGAGFPNHHARIFVQRRSAETDAELATYTGWI